MARREGGGYGDLYLPRLEEPLRKPSKMAWKEERLILENSRK